MQQEVIFILINYKGDQDARTLVGDIRRLGSGVHIIIANNSAESHEDDSFADLKASANDLTVLNLPENLGYFGAAERAREFLGAKGIEPKWLIISNTDIRIKSERFLSCLKHYERSTNCPAVIAPAIISSLSNRDQNPYMEQRPSRFRMHFYKWFFSTRWTCALYQALGQLKKRRLYAPIRRTTLTSFADDSLRRKIYGPHGAFMIFHESYFAKGGTFRHGAFLYGEEITVSETLRQQALECVYEPGIEVHHTEHASTSLVPRPLILGCLKEASRFCADTYFNGHAGDKINTQVDAQGLTGGKLLARNTVWNAVGQMAPLVLAIFAVPMLVNTLGTTRFGILTLAWVFVSYFSFFDFGLGRGITRFVAALLAAGRTAEIRPLVSSTLLLMALFGTLSGIGLAVASPWVTDFLFKVPPELASETRHSLYTLALCIPIVICTSGLRGTLEAFQKFRAVNLLRLPTGFITYLGPILVLPFSHSLVPIVAVLVGGRAIMLVAHAIVVSRLLNGFQLNVSYERERFAPLLSTGGWLMVSNVIIPIMMYLDRFIIGSLVSVAAVAFYTTPYEVVSRLLIIPASVTGVVFPAFASSIDTNPEKAHKIFERGFVYLFLIMLAFCLIVAGISREFLGIWLNNEFAEKSDLVLGLLTIGIFTNGLAYIPLSFLQGVGKAKWTGLLALVEVPLYLLVLWYLTKTHGVDGAAAAWLVRAVLDLGILMFLSQRVLRKSTVSFSTIYVHYFFAAAYLGLLVALPSTGGRLVLTSIGLSALAVYGYGKMLSAEERSMMKNFLRTRVPLLRRV